MKLLFATGFLLLLGMLADVTLVITKNLADEGLLKKVSEIDNGKLREKFTNFLQNYPFMHRNETQGQPTDTGFKGFGISFIDRDVMRLLGIKPARRRKASNRVQTIVNTTQEFHLNYHCTCTCETICNIPKCPRIRNGFFKCKYPDCGERCDLQLEFGDYEYTTTPENRSAIQVEFVTTFRPTSAPPRNRMLAVKITKKLESPYQGKGYLMAAIKQMTTNETLQSDILALLQPDTKQLDKFDERLIGDMRYILKHFKDKLPPHLPKPSANNKKWERKVRDNLGSVITASYSVLGHILAETQPSRLREKRALRTPIEDIKRDGGGPKPCVCDIKCEVSADNCMKRCPAEPRCPPGKCVCTK